MTYRHDDYRPDNGGGAATMIILSAVAFLFFGIGAFAGWAWHSGADRPEPCFALTSHECAALMETR